MNFNEQVVRLAAARRAFQEAEADKRGVRFEELCAVHGDIEGRFGLDAVVRAGNLAKHLPELRIEYGLGPKSSDLRVLEEIDRVYLEWTRKGADVARAQPQTTRKEWESAQARRRAEKARFLGREQEARAWDAIARDGVPPIGPLSAAFSLGGEKALIDVMAGVGA